MTCLPEINTTLFITNASKVSRLNSYKSSSSQNQSKVKIWKVRKDFHSDCTSFPTFQTSIFDAAIAFTYCYENKNKLRVTFYVKWISNEILSILLTSFDSSIITPSKQQKKYSLSIADYNAELIQNCLQFFAKLIDRCHFDRWKLKLFPSHCNFFLTSIL